jgi:hypothetical protein
MYHAYPIAATAFFYPEAVKSGVSSGTSELPDRYHPGIFCLASSMVSFHTSLVVETLFDSQGYL